MNNFILIIAKKNWLALLGKIIIPLCCQTMNVKG